MSHFTLLLFYQTGFYELCQSTKMGSTKWGGRRKWDRPNARDEMGKYEIGCDQIVAHGDKPTFLHHCTICELAVAFENNTFDSKE